MSANVKSAISVKYSTIKNVDLKVTSFAEKCYTKLSPWVYGTLSSHEFEREQRELHGKDWREEIEGGKKYNYFRQRNKKIK